MAYHYSTEKRAASPTSLPDFETLHSSDYPPNERPEKGWYYAWLDGGLDCWSSDPFGPYDTEAEAVAAAREEAQE